jgi:outer membrane receptor for ferrienterochelin and colicin
VNKERIKSRGVEIGSKIKITDDLSGHLSYTLQSTKEIGEGRLTNSPTHSGSLGLSRMFSRYGGSLSIETFYLSARKTVQDTTLPGAAVISLNGGIRPWVKGPVFYAGVYNLTNVNYAASGAGEHLQAAIRQDGRSYNFRTEYRF